MRRHLKTVTPTNHVEHHSKVLSFVDCVCTDMAELLHDSHGAPESTGYIVLTNLRREGQEIPNSNS